jgi:uncharacterized protein (DUF433 family)
MNHPASAEGDAMKKETIGIVDRGRGPQLSGSRITVQDLVPYIQQNYTHEQIQEIMPVLTDEEIRAIEQYVRENFEAVMEQDRRIRERAESRRKTPDQEEAERQERLARIEAARRQIRDQKQERNGDSASG